MAGDRAVPSLDGHQHRKAQHFLHIPIYTILKFLKDAMRARCHLLGLIFFSPFKVEGDPTTAWSPWRPCGCPRLFGFGPDSPQSLETWLPDAWQDPDDLLVEGSGGWIELDMALFGMGDFGGRLIL